MSTAHKKILTYVVLVFAFSAIYTAYVIDEFGIGLALALALLGYLCWRKRGTLPKPAQTS